MAHYRILSTKKLLSNQKLFLLNADLAVVEADFIGILYKPFDINLINPNLIFTSRNGFKAFLENKLSVVYQGSNVFCVGANTRMFIERNGFNVVECTDDAATLGNLITQNYTGEKFTFFSGSLRRDALPLALQATNIDFNEIEVYDTILTPHKINTPVDGIMFFSPSGV